MNNNYVVYHLHSDLSSCITSIDSVTKPDEYIEKAKELGMTSLAFSEHGACLEWVFKKEHIEKAGMKYIHAEEFYVTKTLDEKIRDNRHLVLIARNYDGVLELNKLTSKSFNRADNSFYYVPRITIDDVMHTSDNIIITSACLGGIINGSDKEMRNSFIKFMAKNKHRCFLEVQHHQCKDQILYNKKLYALSKKTGIRLIAGTDTHALNDEHMEARAILQKAKNISFPEEDKWDLTFKTYEELVEAYRKQNALPINIALEAIENTNIMADMVEPFELDRSYKYPHLWKDSEKVFADKIKQGIKTRGVNKYPNFQEYKDRIKYELAAYRHNEAIDFMLLMEDIASWCKAHDIQLGYGRGSVNGSVIAWLLGITEMDSIKHGLNFDRFMNVERVSLSDIDTDLPPSRINEVKDYIFNKHGLYCCDIATFNTIADKGAIRDVGRALKIPLKEVDSICATVDNEQEYEESRKKHQELFKYVDMVKGVVVSMGNHPCGTVVSPYSVDDRMGLYTTTTDNYPISQIYMKEVDSLNYVKLDLLKLDTIELISNTCKLAEIPMVTPDNLDITDVKVWNSMRDDTTQIFQWEGKTGEDYIKKLLSDENIEKFKAANKDIDRMTLLSIGNSAIRPAGASYRDDLASGVIRKSGSQAIDDFLKPTFGFLVFQCQIIEFLHSYCGFTMGEADLVRRHFAKKVGTEADIPIIKEGGYLTEGRKHYIPGFIETMKEKYGMDKAEAENTIVAFLQVITDASNYLFSINHSQPYSYEGYASAWLRYYYPVEFITCALNINTDKEEKTTAISQYAQKVGVQIEGIRFRHSKSEYACDRENKIIYKGIGSIKNLTSTAGDALYSLRNNTYSTFIDLLVDLKPQPINSRQLDILVRLNFFSEFGDPGALLTQIEIFNSLYGKKQIKYETYPYDIEMLKSHAVKCTEKMAKFEDTLPLIKDIVEHTTFKKLSVESRLKAETEYIGMITLTYPKMSDEIYYVTNAKGYKGKTLELYQLKTGRTLTVKDRVKKMPVPEVGSFIQSDEIYKDFKWVPLGEDENGKMKFKRSEEKEFVMASFKILKNKGAN